MLAECIAIAHILCSDYPYTNGEPANFYAQNYMYCYSEDSFPMAHEINEFCESIDLDKRKENNENISD